MKVVKIWSGRDLDGLYEYCMYRQDGAWFITVICVDPRLKVPTMEVHEFADFYEARDFFCDVCDEWDFTTALWGKIDSIPGVENARNN